MTVDKICVNKIERHLVGRNGPASDSLVFPKFKPLGYQISEFGFFNENGVACDNMTTRFIFEFRR